ncbi:MAG: hypothetical protein FWE42_04320 [Defluviitaleaceae bacterium]|nr:hypothetical protein [Defluviitaleaceae bacterium]
MKTLDSESFNEVTVPSESNDVQNNIETTEVAAPPISSLWHGWDSQHSKILMDTVFAAATKTAAPKMEEKIPGWNRGRLGGSDFTQIESRSGEITKIVKTLVDGFAKSDSDRRNYREIFFVITMISYIGVLIACLVAIFCLSSYTAAVVGAFGTILTTVIALPQIIAKNLFPAKEEDKSIELIREVFKGDIDLRKHYENPGSHRIEQKLSTDSANKP